MKWLIAFCLICCTHTAQAALDEYVISTQDKSCPIKYLSQNVVPKDYVVRIKNATCPKRGYQTVELLDAAGVVKDTVAGYIIDGYLVADAPLSSSIVKRTNRADGVQDAYYAIEYNTDLSIDYVGQMNSTLSKGIYPTFTACEPFHLIAITDKTKPFTKPQTLENIFTVARSYAYTICPNAKNMLFDVSKNHDYDKKIVARYTFFKDNNGAWQIDKARSVNTLMNKRQQTEKKTELVKQSYELLQKMPPYHRPAFLMGQAQMDMPIQLLAAAETLNTPVSGVFVAHVKPSENTVETQWIDTPFAMQTTSRLAAGWYLIKGALFPMTAAQKKKAGLPLLAPAALLDIMDKQVCQQPHCADFQDSAHLLETKYGLPSRFFVKESM